MLFVEEVLLVATVEPVGTAEGEDLTTTLRLLLRPEPGFEAALAGLDAAGVDAAGIGLEKAPGKLAEVDEAEGALKADEAGSEGGTVAVLPPVPIEGDGAAVEEPASVPIPQGIWSPLGCVKFAAGVTLPFESAIAKRVVQVLSSEEGEVNW